MQQAEPAGTLTFCVNMFKGRGRGKPPQWYTPLSPIILPGNRDICVGKQKKLSIVRTNRKGRGFSVNVVVQEFANEDEENSGGVSSSYDKTCLSPAPKCMHLLMQGVFVDTPRVSGLNDFPERILKNIFSFINDVKSLVACERVCRRWKALLSKPDVNPLYDVKSSVKRIRVRRIVFVITNRISSSIECSRERSHAPIDGNYYLVQWSLPAKFANQNCILSFVESVFVKFYAIYDLSFESFDIWNDLLKLVVKYQKQISNLRFLRCVIRPDALAELKPLKEMKHFALDLCVGGGDAISTELLTSIMKANSITQLELCGLNNFVKVNDVLLDAMVSSWKSKRISFMKLAKCPGVTTDGISKLINEYYRCRSGQLTMFLDRTGFDVEAFLQKQKCFRRDQTPNTSRRVLLKGPGVSIWVEL